MAPKAKAKTKPGKMSAKLIKAQVKKAKMVTKLPKKKPVPKTAEDCFEMDSLINVFIILQKEKNKA